MNPMVAQIQSLPDLIRGVVPIYHENIRRILSREYCQSIRHVYLTGCGDSHHASIGTQLAFRKLTGITTEAMTSMQFARYTADTLIEPKTCLVVGASVSGEVSRTVEGLLLARKAGASTLALTAAPVSRIARSADLVLNTTQPVFEGPPGMTIPGMRSFVANQVGLLLIAIHFGEQIGRLSASVAAQLRRELEDISNAVEETSRLNEENAYSLAENWLDSGEFVFCGSGPNFASALFSAAKILEATGDPALGQDLEEWAHLQYFAKRSDTPTFILSGGDRDLSRALEIVTAAQALGRRVALIAPADRVTNIVAGVALLPISSGIREMFSPLLTFIPASFFAAARADLMGEPYFRAFGGGRSQEGGGGISRIRTSETLGLEYLQGE